MLTEECLIEVDRILNYFKEGSTSKGKEEMLDSLKENSIVQVIGEGASSVVFRVSGATENYALKAIKDKLLFNREVSALRALCHPNIISLKGSTTINRHYCVYLEHLPYCQSLWEYIRYDDSYARLVHGDEGSVLSIFQQLVSALTYLHERGISHHDLNTKNVLIDSETKVVKIIDFGLAVVLPKGESYMVDHGYGTPLYLPIEVLEGRSHDPLAVDVWGLGVILVEMLLKTHPWKSATSLSHLAQMIVSVDRAIDWRGERGNGLHISPMMKGLVDTMLQVEPECRVEIRRVNQMVKEMLGGGGLVIAG